MTSDVIGAAEAPAAAATASGPGGTPAKARGSRSAAGAAWHSTRGLRVGAAMLIVMLVASFAVPLLSPYDATTTAGVTLSPPGSEHLFGTDNLGRDIFTRTFAAARLDIGVALLGVSVPLIVGTIVGAVLGLARSRVLSAVVRTIIDGINAFPVLALIIGLVAVLGVGLQSLIIALAITNWARYARIARARAMVVRDQDFVQATTVLGYSKPRVILRHVLPNVSSETVAYALSDFILVIVVVSGLSFLGLGVRPPTPEWGAMMSDGRLYLRQAWWITVFPGLALSWTGIAMAFIAEGVRRRQRGEL
jgi:peptide/nickel transport system permease protein